MRRLVLTPALLALLAAPAAADGRLRFAQLTPEGDLLGTFEISCDAERCAGAGTLIGSDGAPARVEATARLSFRELRLAMVVEGGDVSTPGLVSIPLRDGRGVRDVPLVRGWVTDRRGLRDGAWRPDEPSGLRLRVSYGP